MTGGFSTLSIEVEKLMMGEFEDMCKSGAFVGFIVGAQRYTAVLENLFHGFTVGLKSRLIQKQCRRLQSVDCHGWFLAVLWFLGSFFTLYHIDIDFARCCNNI